MTRATRISSTLRGQEKRILHSATATLADPTVDPARRVELLRSILRLQVRVWARVSPSLAPATEEDDAVARLAQLANIALRELGASADPPEWSLKEYDADRLGPILGVSDDGDAAQQIVRALLDSPKARVLRRLGLLSPRTIGACVDAERMSAAGELLVGPDEYAKVRHAVVGRVPMTTNVGTVVLPRFYRTMPFVTIKGRRMADPTAAAIAEVRAAFAPYRNPPDGGVPLEITVYVAFRGEDRLRRDAKVAILRALVEATRDESVSDPQGHRLGLLQRASNRGSQAPMLAIDMAADSGLTEVVIEGHPRFESQDQLLLPGLLAFFDAKRVNEILKHARSRGVTITTKNRIDTRTAARTIWAGLTAARGMGAHLGKFGLFPLTLEEQIETIQYVQPWFSTWTPTPAFYVDRPIVTADGVRAGHELVDPAIRWIQGSAEAGTDVVLIDSPDRTPAPAGTGLLRYHEDRGRRLLKRQARDDLGVWSWEDLDRILAAARKCSPPVRILWAGGIDGRQAYELARRKAFGIFTTSSTARRVAIASGAGDPSSTSEMEPTYLGVLGVRMVIEAGFLSVVMAEREAAITAAAEPVLMALEQGRLTTPTDAGRAAALDDLRDVLEQSWDVYLNSAPGIAS